MFCQVSEHPEEAAVRLRQACSRLTPPLRLQPGAGPQFVVTAESLADRLMTQAASRRRLQPGPLRVWDAPPEQPALRH